MANSKRKGIYKEYANNGDVEWYKDGKLHRENHPAIIMKRGTKMWYQNGLCHREDGPAIEHLSGVKFWYLHDVEYTEEEFNIYLEKKKLSESLQNNLHIKNPKPKVKI